MNKKNIHNKKGLVGETMKMILIVASAIALLLFFGGWIIIHSGGDESINKCRLSVITQASTSFGMIDKDSPFNVNCDKRYVTFYNTRVERGLSPEDTKPILVNYGNTKSKKFSSLNEFVVNQVVAEELRVCKFEFGDGQIDIFPNDDKGILDRNICFVCSEITFESSVKPNVFTGLKEFTQQATYSEENIKYYDYLTEPTIFKEPMWQQGVQPPGPPTDEYSNMPINTSQKYLIYVQRYKSGAARNLKWVALAAGPMGAIVTVLVKTNDGIIVGITSDKYINDICDRQAS